MLPIQFIFLLIIVSLPGQLAQAAKDAGGAAPALEFIPVPVAWASLVVTQAALVAWVVARTRGAIRMLHEPSTAATPIAFMTDRLFTRARWFICMITAAHLFSTPLPRVALGWFEGTQILKYMMLPELLFLTPAVLAWLAIWTAAYHVDEALRERSLPYQLARGMPVHEMPGLGQYLVMQIRHNFYPFIFLLFQGLVTILAAIITGYTPSDPKGNLAQVIVTGGSGILLILLLPAILTRIWSTTPLTGPLRRRLDAVAELYGLRFRNILLWRSHNMMVNAAIVGWIPQGRYFLLSDALVESFSDQQLEAVFAHEVGHGIHRHLHWMVLAIFSAVGLAAGLAGITVALLPVNQAQGDMAALVLSSALLCALVGGAIAVISPRFEHQADWFACRHMALRLREAAEGVAAPAGEALPAALAEALPEGPTGAEGVTVAQYVAGEYPHSREAGVDGGAGGTGGKAAFIELAGAEIFVSSLDAIIETSHRDRNRRGWFHPSVANRAALVRELAVNPEAEARFDKSMRRVRWGIVALAAVGLGAFAVAVCMPGKAEAPAAQAGGARGQP